MEIASFNLVVKRSSQYNISPAQWAHASIWYSDMIHICPSHSQFYLNLQKKLRIGIKPLSPLTKDIIAPICLNLSIVSRNNGLILFFRESKGKFLFVIVMALREKKGLMLFCILYQIWTWEKKHIMKMSFRQPYYLRLI